MDGMGRVRQFGKMVRSGLALLWRKFVALFAWAREEAFISRIYYESMRDNFEGYAWDSNTAKQKKTNANKAKLLKALKLEFAALDPLKGNRATLGQLFKIELALIWVVPEEALRARFWTIEDRFNRVVPTSVARSYRSSFQTGPQDKVPEKVLRQRASNLLDVIHANYLINLAREKSIKRMMVILFLAAAGIATLVYTQVATTNELAKQGLLVIMAAGMAGGMISIVQRLQKATSRDATVDDGIFELIGLRVGWLSVLMSIGIGGVFALFLYVLSAAHLLEIVLPAFKETLGGGINGAIDPAKADAVAKAAADTSAAAAAAPPTAPVGGNGASPDQNAGWRKRCDIELCNSWLAQVTAALGFKDIGQYYKMVALAFVAGFAERFVPDIINKLTKEPPLSWGGSSGGSRPS